MIRRLSQQLISVKVWGHFTFYTAICFIFSNLIYVMFSKNEDSYITAKVLIFDFEIQLSKWFAKSVSLSHFISIKSCQATHPRSPPSTWWPGPGSSLAWSAWPPWAQPAHAQSHQWRPAPGTGRAGTPGTSCWVWIILWAERGHRKRMWMPLSVSRIYIYILSLYNQGSRLRNIYKPKYTDILHILQINTSNVAQYKLKVYFKTCIPCYFG